MPKVPVLGNVPKGGLFAGGLAVVAVGGFLVYKKLSGSKTTAPPTSSPYAYGYGSAYAYGYGTQYGYGGYGPGGFGGGGYPPYPYGYGNPPPGPTGGPPTTNAEWGQQAEADLGSSGTDAIAAALGKYLSGAPITTDQNLIVQEATAVLGPPPQASPTGFPPKAHVTKGGGSGGGATNPVTGLRVSKPGTTGVDVSWGASSGATSYVVTSTHGHASMIGPTSARIHDIGRHTSATVQVLAEPAASGAQPATITVKTN